MWTANLSVEEPDALMCARPDLWEPWVRNHPGPPGPALAKIAPIKVFLSSARWRGVAVGVPVPGRHSRAHVEPTWVTNGRKPSAK